METGWYKLLIALQYKVYCAYVFTGTVQPCGNVIMVNTLHLYKHPVYVCGVNRVWLI